MNLAVVTSAQRHYEFIAHLAAERWTLRKAHVVGVRWLAAADQARLFGNEADVIAVANPPRLREGQHALVDSFGAPLPNPARGSSRVPRFRGSGRVGCLANPDVSAGSLASLTKVAARATNASSTR